MIFLKWNKRYSIVCFFAFIVIITGLLYFPVIKTPFLFDDISSIVDNPAIRTLDLRNIYNFAPLRFLGYLSFALNFHFFKLAVFSYHIVNICIHILFILFSFLFMKTLLQTPSGRQLGLSPDQDRKAERIAMAAALILCVHPLSTFAVSYIVQRLASLTALFYVSSLFFYLKARLSKTIQPRLLFSGLFIVFMICALFTKQNSFTIFPQILFMEVFCFGLTKRKKWVFFACFLIMIALMSVVLIYNNINLDEIRNITRDTASITRAQYLFTEFSVICFYLKEFFIPLKLAIDYFYPVLVSLSDPKVMIPGLILAGIILSSVLPAIKKKHLRLAAYGIIFYFTAISIESSIIPIRDTIFLHRTYLPDVGLVFTFVIGIYLILKKKKIPAYIPCLLFCICIIVFSALTFRTNMIFQKPVKVWKQVLKISPDSTRAHVNLGKLYLYIKGKQNDAGKHIMEVYRRQPDNLDNLNNLGILLLREKKYQQAIACYNKIIRKDKTSANAYANLGNIYCSLEKYNTALKIFKKGYEIDSNNYTNLLGLGQLLAILAHGSDSQYYTALKILKRAELINNKDSTIYYAKGLAWYNLKNYTKAENNFKKSLNFQTDSNLNSSKYFLQKIKSMK